MNVDQLTTVRQAPTHRDPVCVSAILDATDENIKPCVLDRLQGLEEVKAQFGDSFQASADIYQHKTPGLFSWNTAKKLGSVSNLLVTGAAAVGSAYVALNYGLQAGALAFPTILGGSLALVELMRQLEDPRAPLQRSQKFWPKWEGRRTYTVEADQSSKPDSPVVLEDPEQKKFTSESVKSQLVQAIRAYPNSLQVCWPFGHGLGHLSMASQPFPEFADGLKQAQQETGRPLDLVVFESCLMGNLEALTAMGTSSRYVLASEPSIRIDTPEGSIPMAEIVEALGTPGDLSQKIAKTTQTLEGVNDLHKPDQMTLFNLAELQQRFLPTLDSLGEQLSSEFEAGRGTEVMKAVEAATEVKNLLGIKVLADLPTFLTKISESNLSQATQEKAVAALEAYDQAAPYRHHERRVKGHEGLSFAPYGVSIQWGEEKLDTGVEGLPEGWKKFLAHSTQTIVSKISPEEAPSEQT